ncbi:MAG: hypothetical protein IKR59_04650 [Lachnospiraceae bacterium]|nr:hypothetical protein [Lachnospiraceae bacterium]
MTDRIVCFRPGEGAGETRKLNLEIRRTDADLVLVLAEGMKAADEAELRQMAEAFEEDPLLAAYYGKAVLPEGKCTSRDFYFAAGESAGITGNFGASMLYTAGNSLFLCKAAPVMYRRSLFDELGFFEADCILDAACHFRAKVLYRGYKIREADHAAFTMEDMPEHPSFFRCYFSFGRMLKSGIQEFGFSIPLSDVQAAGRDNPVPYPGAAAGIARRFAEAASLAAARGKRLNPIFIKICPKIYAFAEKLGEKYLYLPSGLAEKWMV